MNNYQVARKGSEQEEAEEGKGGDHGFMTYVHDYDKSTQSQTGAIISCCTLMDCREGDGLIGPLLAAIAAAFCWAMSLLFGWRMALLMLRRAKMLACLLAAAQL
jgi:hypothetical protein